MTRSGCGRPDPGEAAALLAAEKHELANQLQILSALLAHRRRRLTDPAATAQIRWVEQVVSSLMSLQAPPGDGQPETAFGRYLSRQVETWRSLGAAGSVAIELAVEDVAVPKARQTTLALAANELVTNAVEHAFRGRSGGSIRIALRQVGETEAELTVADDGIGLSPDAEAAGSGLELLDRMARHLRGTLRIDGGSAGTTVRLRFPIA